MRFRLLVICYIVWGHTPPDAVNDGGILLMAVQYGPWKNKGHRHLKVSYRPGTAGAALPGVESAAAQLLLSTSPEESEYSLEVFSYRKELNCHQAVLSLRAIMERCLRCYGSVACFGWDDDNAFLRVEREQAERLFDMLPGAWNCGQWVKQ